MILKNNLCAYRTTREVLAEVLMEFCEERHRFFFLTSRTIQRSLHSSCFINRGIFLQARLGLHSACWLQVPNFASSAQKRQRIRWPQNTCRWGHQPAACCRSVRNLLRVHCFSRSHVQIFFPCFCRGFKMAASQRSPLEVCAEIFLTLSSAVVRTWHPSTPSP